MTWDLHIRIDETDTTYVLWSLPLKLDIVLSLLNQPSVNLIARCHFPFFWCLNLTWGVLTTDVFTVSINFIYSSSLFYVARLMARIFQVWLSVIPLSEPDHCHIQCNNACMILHILAQEEKEKESGYIFVRNFVSMHLRNYLHCGAIILLTFSWNKLYMTTLEILRS